MANMDKDFINKFVDAFAGSSIFSELLKGQGIIPPLEMGVDWAMSGQDRTVKVKFRPGCKPKAEFLRDQIWDAQEMEDLVLIKGFYQVER